MGNAPAKDCQSFDKGAQRVCFEAILGAGQKCRGLNPKGGLKCYTLDNLDKHKWVLNLYSMGGTLSRAADPTTSIQLKRLPAEESVDTLVLIGKDNDLYYKIIIHKNKGIYLGKLYNGSRKRMFHLQSWVIHRFTSNPSARAVLKAIQAIPQSR